MEIIELHFNKFNYYMSFLEFPILFQNRFQVAWQISLKKENTSSVYL